MSHYGAEKLCFLTGLVRCYVGPFCNVGHHICLSYKTCQLFYFISLQIKFLSEKYVGGCDDTRQKGIKIYLRFRIILLSLPLSLSLSLSLFFSHTQTYSKNGKRNGFKWQRSNSARKKLFSTHTYAYTNSSYDTHTLSLSLSHTHLSFYHTHTLCLA